MRRNDPRIRQTLNHISQTLESANQTTQTTLFTLTENYLNPCFSSLHTCLEASCAPCFTARDDRLRHRNRAHARAANPRGRAELSFDFYDDWDDDADAGAAQGLLGGWGNDELDRLLAGSGAHEAPGEQPGRHRAMSYGSRSRRRALSKDAAADPTVVPSSSMFGKRSGTATSGSTSNSLSSRGDLFPSEDEDDAVPLDDEFAMVLERRTTGTTSDDHSSGKKRQGRRPTGSRASIKTASSRDTKDTGKRKSSFASSKVSSVAEAAEVQAPSLTDLKLEEERLRLEEEAEVERKREAAQKLALERGLSSHEDDIKPPPEEVAEGTEHPTEAVSLVTGPSDEAKAMPPPSEESRTSISREIPVLEESPISDSPIPASSPEPKPPDSGA
ncbi:Zinc finger, C2H2 [Lasallia pustulata]|uniref:Zinc finger, C2H2 n=1 Tax=Lasallia pustulata TaxID=136370 RepID=A0A1W5CUI9_9LECA|nr:Zinc finger, C2H2 [Lasallia pustulata]